MNIDKWLGQYSNPMAFLWYKEPSQCMFLSYLFCVWIVKSKMLKRHVELGHIFNYDGPVDAAWFSVELICFCWIPLPETNIYILHSTWNTRVGKWISFGGRPIFIYFHGRTVSFRGYKKYHHLGKLSHVGFLGDLVLFLWVWSDKRSCCFVFRMWPPKKSAETF